MRNKYSIWLMPSGEVLRRLRGLIAWLSERYSTALFEPHVTLIGGLPGADIVSKASRLASLIRPHEVRLKGIEHRDEYYRCLYIRVEETEDVARAEEMARLVFGRRDDRPYMPHLSLMYGGFPTHVKEDIIRGIGELETSFVPDSIHLFSTLGEPAEWRRIRELPLGRS
jgi:2'-5' RNA ligase